MAEAGINLHGAPMVRFGTLDLLERIRHHANAENGTGSEGWSTTEWLWLGGSALILGGLAFGMATESHDPDPEAEQICAMVHCPSL
jgi:hypothetical protein